jgi:hypothetical protein
VHLYASSGAGMFSGCDFHYALREDNSTQRTGEQNASRLIFAEPWQGRSLMKTTSFSPNGLQLTAWG